MTDRSWTFRTAATIVALAAASATFSTFAVAQAADGTSTKTSAVDRNDPQPAKAREHDFDGPLTKTKEAQRQEALDQVISGNATVKNRNGSQVVELKSRKGDSKYVELGREKTDKIFTILVEFGDEVDPATAARSARCTTRSPSPTASRTTARPGRRTTTRRTSRTSTSAPARRASR